jgi:TATA-box binding protein (TBP) (component of TFIID and TFIIIB)
MIKITNNRNIHVKLFSNGTMQITGCKTIYNFVEVMKILCRKLLEIKFTYNLITKKTVKKTFVTEPDNIIVEIIGALQIRMINSNFHIGFMIDRVILYKLLLEKKYECNYDQCSHAAVNLKYKCEGEDVSIFIFESGSIIITGAKNKNHICESYNFIVTFLHDNYNLIVKRDINKFLQRPDIKKIINDTL